ncbi:MAG: AbrB/MazE/SpoVT family DNA-binding domain-containing protein, partial [Pseudolabrys sp.]
MARGPVLYRALFYQIWVTKSPEAAIAVLKIFAMKLRIYIKKLYISELVMQVAKWGNSLAIRLPRSVVEVLGLKEGDSIEIHVADRRSFAIEKAHTSKQLLERLRKYRGRLPAGFRFDRLEANERG